ncbi:uncharacterized protein F5891DRAFT_1131171 [Suillus fuscotomentosus]|uniref:Uncharacterized protein n=1 Tax=Suillus fuscotomentosus TaxID=1912939 RepID=A0AAD4HEM9_9AGAM|nr:uncharacterized protein F5891DRAFT_1131171 [Suillus fuscotomentosus]KAG1893712.1 hypothetical protein F5891DRAFT_1131171 [Suillus fuscotomentosus]
MGEGCNNIEAHQQIKECIAGQDNIVIVPYPNARAGKPITGCPIRCANTTYGLNASSTANIYAPFPSRIDWDIAKWVKLHGPSSTAFTDLLGIDGFKHKQIIVTGEAFDVFYRDIIECIKVLYGNPDFADFLVFVPEHHYADEDQTVQLFHDMHTGQWWWDTQKALDQRRPGATIIPIIISSDKTQVMMFRNKSAYPPSRHAHILLAYLPTTRLEHITNKASRCCTIANLYHACMSRILAPLKTAGIDGLQMSSGDGVQRHCHPLFACFSGDYPEQLLATGVKTMECLKCDIPTEELGSNTAPFDICDLHAVLDALARFDDGDLVFMQACHEARIKPIVYPFWEDLPHANIFQAITPDILHQLYQEHSQICQFLLGIIVDIRLPGNLASSRLLKAVHGLLDFLYLAQYPSHSSETLILLDEARTLFHDNKDIFYTEWLHIDLAKDAYCATNHKDEFTQMTKIVHHEQFIKWHLDGDCAPHHHPRPPDLGFDRPQQLTKHLSIKAVPIQKLITDYGATYFRQALACYIAQHQNPNEAINHQRLENLAAGIHLPFHAVPVYHKINTGSSAGVKGFHVGQIHIVFLIPASATQFLFNLENQPPKHLAYVEWFTPFPAALDPRHSMYKISQLIKSGQKVASIIPVSNITCSVHLMPKFGAIAPIRKTSYSKIKRAMHTTIIQKSAAIYSNKNKHKVHFTARDINGQLTGRQYSIWLRKPFTAVKGGGVSGEIPWFRQRQ